MHIINIGNIIHKKISNYFFSKHVPVILQLTQNECGAACLAMILTYYGRKTTISQCREFCDPGRDGLTAKTIVQAARCFGLHATAVSVDLINLKFIQLPAIVHWNFNHYIIIEKWTPKKIVAVDPAIGRRRLTLQEFDVCFTGVALTFKPSEHFEKRSIKETSLWIKYLRNVLRLPGSMRAFLQVIIISLLMQIFGLAFPIFTKILIDNVIPLRIDSIMPILGLAMILLIFSRVITSYIRGALFVYLQGHIDTQMMTGFFKHLLSLPYQFFYKLSTGDLLMRLGSNALIRQTLTTQSISVLLDGIFVIFYLIVILSQSAIYGGIVVVFGLMQVMILFLSRRKMQDLMRNDLAVGVEAQSYLIETLRGIGTLKASGTEKRTFDHWTNLFNKHMNIILQRGYFGLTLGSIWTFISTLWPFVLLWLGTYLVMNGAMTLGTMLALNALAGAFLTPLSSLVSAGQQLQVVRAYLERIFHVMDTQPEQDNQPYRKVPAAITSVELKNVSFKYNKNSQYALQNMSTIIKGGQKVALVGRTGAGKSTLAMTLLGLFTPEKGEILYNNIPLQKLDYQSLRSQFGVVLQETYLYNGTIRQNISFNNPNIALEQVQEAAKIAAIHEEIMQLPMNYETIVLEGGIGFSGGQRQRLSIARALANKPTLLLLDEATNHLDAATEASIDKNLNRLSCTRIVIAHRLSTIKNADLILVIEQGTIIEQGNHDNLLALGGCYAALVECQLDTDSGKTTAKTNVELIHNTSNYRSATHGYSRESTSKSVKIRG
jgi:ABC-type bacteriocin/lantibiotic exporter with double-glycine peptidase domain